MFDPPSPFSTQRHLLSTLTPEPWGPNLNRDENWCPNSSKSNPRSNLDVEDVLKPLTILELGSGTGIIIAKLAEVINKEARDGPDGQFQVFHSPSLIALKSGSSLGLGDVIIATDLDNVCPLLEENLSSAAKMFWKNDQTNPRVLVRPLEWGVHKHSLKVLNELGSRSLTHIVCSDLVSFLHNSRGGEGMGGFHL